MPKSAQICIPLKPASLDELQKGIRDALMIGDLVEIYLDYLPEVSQEVLTSISQAAPKAILTFRRPGFEQTTRDTAAQKAMMSLISHNNLMVDLDIYKERELINAAQAKELQIIISYHNYFHTPTLPELTTIFDEMKGTPAYGLKIACHCNEDADALRLLQLLVRERTNHATLVVTGMGSRSKMTRVVGALWGNAWTYAPLEAVNATARGQIPANSLRSLINMYGGI